MDTAMTEEKLRETFDRITREVTRKTAGIQLTRRGYGPQNELYTVHVGFRRGFQSSLSLRADAAMLTRLSRAILREENITPQDLEDAGKEYLNVLCGHIARALFQATRVPTRFGVPSFYRGAFSPEGQREQFALNYSDDRNDSAQLVHHVPIWTSRGGQGGKINISSHNM